MIKSILIALVVIAALAVVFGTGILKQDEPSPAGISNEEKAQIDAWLQENDLNQYGDPKDTVYAGGTPLFDERTGETIDRYEYILRKHPQKSWGK